MPPYAQAATTAFYLAIGQYIVYRALLSELGSLTPLYLAIPQQTFEAIYDSTFERVIRDNDVRMMIVDTEREVITRWINQ